MNILSVTKSAFNMKLIIDKYTRNVLKLSTYVSISNPLFKEKEFARIK